MNKMKFILPALLATTMFFGSCSEEKTAEVDSSTSQNEEMKVDDNQDNGPTTYELDSDKSKVQWTGTMLGLYSHNGTLNFTDGSFTVQGDKMTGGSFTVDMKSITPMDENYGEENPKGKLIGHLSSEDFFSVEEYPTASFEFGMMDGNMVKGQMTLRGVTQDVLVTDVTLVKGLNGACKMNGKLTLDRQQFGVAFDMGMKDKVLSDDLELEILIASKY